ncbi:hypothetical protein C8Q80DRAFT_856391 [Daedaleopsis nitida]|nr:hypothetical protein C8Q80DRAFT_856391 [Daedaleopsis nitida]
MGASPAMARRVQTPRRTPAGPARSLIDMRDRTSWSYNENFAIWDARAYFSLDKEEDLQYKHENVASLPRLEQDLEFGDIAILYHSISTYDVIRPSGGSSGDKPPAFNEANTALSLNLYGAALVSKHGSKSI